MVGMADRNNKFAKKKDGKKQRRIGEKRNEVEKIGKTLRKKSKTWP